MIILSLLLIHVPGQVSGFNFAILRQQNTKLESLLHLLKQAIPPYTTIIPLGRWSNEENQVLCNIQLSVSKKFWNSIPS